MEAFTESISFDAMLFREDIAGSIAHANMLSDQQLISPGERDQIIDGLMNILAELESGEFSFRPELEDIHMNIEQALIDRLGDVGRKLHTGRSRNDQVSTDMRLWIRGCIDRVDGLLAGLQKSFVQLAITEGEVVIPAYTHLQRAQPVLAAHYFLAYCEKLERDRLRLRDCRHIDRHRE